MNFDVFYWLGEHVSADVREGSVCVCVCVCVYVCVQITVSSMELFLSGGVKVWLQIWDFGKVFKMDIRQKQLHVQLSTSTFGTFGCILNFLNTI